MSRRFANLLLQMSGARGWGTREDGESPESHVKLDAGWCPMLSWSLFYQSPQQRTTFDGDGVFRMSYHGKCRLLKP